VGFGTGVVVVVLVAATVFGVLRLFTDGRFRGTHRVRGAGRQPGSVAAEPTAPPGPLTGTDLEHALGERATLLQFSSAFCAPCRATRRVLADVAAVVPGVEHVEVDAEHHLELVRRVDVLRTPTTLVLDKHGREVSRASGALRKEQVLAALAAAVEDPGPDGDAGRPGPDGPDGRLP
jgi:thiol-disulfide isomerase/thioredoxin